MPLCCKFKDMLFVVAASNPSFLSTSFASEGGEYARSVIVTSGCFFLIKTFYGLEILFKSASNKGLLRLALVSSLCNRSSAGHLLRMRLNLGSGLPDFALDMLRSRYMGGDFNVSFRFAGNCEYFCCVWFLIFSFSLRK